MDEKRAIFFSHSRAHLRGAKEGYLSHLRVAAGIGATMILAGGACMVHGLLPGLFTDRASRAIRRLNARISSRHQGPLIDALNALEYEI